MALDQIVDQRADLRVVSREELKLVERDQDRSIPEQFLERRERGPPVCQRLLLIHTAPRDAGDLSADVLELISF